MAQLQLGDVANAYSFISISINPTKTKFYKKGDHHASFYFAADDDVNTTRSIGFICTFISPATNLGGW